MGSFHLHVDIIGRSSVRSATGASAYQAAEKLESVAHAAYQSGEKIYAEGDKIIHDYTRKKGVVHKEIILPKGAPEKFRDRETLWNAVEARETHKNARFSREIDVALQREFTLEENIEILREYAKEKFVNKGLGVDLAIHDTGDGNPHAHIMFTTRFITPAGLGRKDRDLDKHSELVGWRKGWADINNRKFEEKGLDERIDHRSYKARGIDRQPTIHMGYAATALERKGVKTKKGDYNREIKRRNEEREAAKMAQNKAVREKDVALSPEPLASKEDSTEGADEKPATPAATKTAQVRELTEKTTSIENVSTPPIQERNEQSNATKTARLMVESEEYRKAEKVLQALETLQKNQIDKMALHRLAQLEAQKEARRMTDIEEHLRLERATQFIEKIRGQQEIAKHLHGSKGKYTVLEKDLYTAKAQRNAATEDVPQLRYYGEQVDKYAGNIEVLRSRPARLQEIRQNLRPWDIGKKRAVDKKIRQAEQDIIDAQEEFKKRFKIDPSQASAEIKRVRKLIRDKKTYADIKTAQIQEILEKQAAIELDYQTQKLLAEARPDYKQIEKLLEKMSKTPETVRDRLLQERVDCHLNTITDENFKKVIENVSPEQAKILTNIRDTAKAKELELMKALEHERTKSHGHER